MTRPSARRAAPTLVAGLARLVWLGQLTGLVHLAGCSGGAPAVGAPSREAGPAALVVVAEGPCPKLSVQALGERRLLVFGDTGYDLHAWMPGEPLAAAQSLVELVPGGAARDERLSSGLPTDERGYVAADLSLGGASEASAWLVRTTSRYEPSGRGALFERSSEGALLGPTGWRAAPAGAVVERPARAAALPSALPSACGAELSFVPLASISTPSGGVVIAGRCADRGPTNLPSPLLRVLHGRADAREYRVEAGPDGTALDGIVNLALAAGSDDDVWLAAWEPFEPPERRRPFVARWDGARWTRERLALREAPMSLARTSDGALWLATGKGLHRRDRAGHLEAVAVPMPHFAEGRRDDVYVHTVRAFGDEVWVEASYRVTLDQKAGPTWASALYRMAPRPPPRVVYCDAREPAERAVTLVESRAPRPPPR